MIWKGTLSVTAGFGIITMLLPVTSLAQSCPHSDLLPRYEDIQEYELPATDQETLSASEGARWLFGSIRDRLVDGFLSTFVPYAPEIRGLYGAHQGLASPDARTRAEAGAKLLETFAYPLLPEDGGGSMSELLRDFMDGMNPDTSRTSGEYQDASYRKQIESTLDLEPGCDSEAEDFRAMPAYESIFGDDPDAPDVCYILPFEHFTSPAADVTPVDGFAYSLPGIASGECGQTGTTGNLSEGYTFWLGVSVWFDLFATDELEEEYWHDGDYDEKISEEERDILNRGGEIPIINPVFSEYRVFVNRDQNTGEKISSQTVYRGSRMHVWVNFSSLTPDLNYSIPDGDLEVELAHVAAWALRTSGIMPQHSDGSPEGATIAVHTVDNEEGCADHPLIEEYLFFRDEVAPSLDALPTGMRQVVVTRYRDLVQRLQSHVDTSQAAVAVAPALANYESVTALSHGNDYDAAVGFEIDRTMAELSPFARVELIDRVSAATEALNQNHYSTFGELQDFLSREITERNLQVVGCPSSLLEDYGVSAYVPLPKIPGPNPDPETSSDGAIQ